MMAVNQFLSLIQDNMGALALHYRGPTQVKLNERGFEGGDWYAIFLAAAEPEPLSAADYHHLNPYISPDKVKETLAQSAGRGFLQAIGPDSYRVTAAGREGLAEFFQVAREAMLRADAPPEADLNRLTDLLRRVVRATAADNSTDHQQLMVSRTQAPPDDAPAIVLIDQYLTDLATYRDDAHLAAWRPHEVEGHGWEAFTFIWRGEANTVEALSQIPQIQGRGYTVAHYTAALDQLVERGWLIKEGEAYRLTEAGQKLRDDVEEQTDRYYNAGFSTLIEAELAELQTLLTEFRDKLRLSAVIDLWPLLNSIPQEWGSLTRPRTQAAFEQTGIDPRFFFSMWQALTFEPEPLTVDKLRKRFPYISARLIAERFSKMVEEGLLTPVADGAYKLSDGVAGRVYQIDEVFGQALADLEILPADELEVIKTTLNRLVEASLQAEQPADKWALTHIHNHVRPDNAPALLHIDQSIDDLNAFRDDCHLAAWQPHEVEGHAWEAFTFIWRGEANTAAELAEKLSFRGHTVEDYAAALQSLAGRGWIEEKDSAYQITPGGKALRESVELLTDTHFYQSWFGLSAGEISRLRELLTKMRDYLQTRQAQAEAITA
jgi:DNA-binding MarR family transcriptional regulator